MLTNYTKNYTNCFFVFFENHVSRGAHRILAYIFQVRARGMCQIVVGAMNASLVMLVILFIRNLLMSKQAIFIKKSYNI